MPGVKNVKSGEANIASTAVGGETTSAENGGAKSGDVANAGKVPTGATTRIAKKNNAESINEAMRDKMKNIISEQKKQQGQKGKRGRPKKIENVETVICRGVVPQPKNAKSVVELEYPNSVLFKKCFSLLKGYEASELVWTFGADRVEIAAKDHFNTTTLICRIDCNYVISYYCAEDLTVSFKLDYVDNLFKSIKKEKYIKFVIEESTKRSQFKVILPNEADGMVSNNNVTLDNNPLNPVIGISNEHQFLIRMKFRVDYLKKILMRAGNSGCINFVKHPDKPFKLEYKTDRLTSVNVARSPGKIYLECNKDITQPIYETVPVKTIKPLTTNTNKDSLLTITVHNDHYVSFMINLDYKDEGKPPSKIKEEDLVPICRFNVFTKTNFEY